MYVRVGLYFLDIILDIALIQRLPKLEKRTVLGTCSRRVAEEEKSIYGVSKTIISNILTMSVLRLLGFQCLLELKKTLTTEWTLRH